VDFSAAASGSEALVEAQDLSRGYGEGEAAMNALAGVNVAFPSSRFAAIMGPSGSGKSTLMHILAGLWPGCWPRSCLRAGRRAWT
jgi:putative ABC transport system ATP-binding protein